MLYVDSLSTKDGAVPTYLDLLKVTISTIVDGFEKSKNNMASIPTSISVEKLSVRYNNGHLALHDVSFQLQTVRFVP
ncbi:iron (chelated) ABC transporter, periplasmic-binding protein [Actinobacillus equuli]|nr:iron (chelated) ABC transporter, periplasmic-binding protein [Actinobacillus equuli]